MQKNKIPNIVMKAVKTIKETLVALGIFSLIFFMLLLLTKADLVEVFFATTVLSTAISLPVLIGMEEKHQMKNKNNVRIIGEIIDVQSEDFLFEGESYKEFTVRSGRKSGICDVIPVFVPYKYIEHVETGKRVFIEGKYVSFNERENGKSHLVLIVCAKYIREEKFRQDEDRIVMEGYICSPPVFRKTPSGIDICDLMIANNNENGTSNYIPCLTWWKDARESSLFKVGDYVKYIGRIQSRIYEKKLNDGEIEFRTAYEVSIGGIIKHEES